MMTTTTTTTTVHHVVLRSENTHGGTLAWDGCDLPPCAALVFGPEFWTDDDALPVGCNHTMPAIVEQVAR